MDAKIKACRDNYVDQLSKLVGSDQNPLIDGLFLVPKEMAKSKSNVVYKIGSSRNSHVFTAMMQFNISGFRGNKVSFNCTAWQSPVSVSLSKDALLYNEPSDPSVWLSNVENPNAKFVWIDDMSMVQIPFSINSQPTLISKISGKISLVNKLFQEMLNCLIPKGQLLVLDTSDLKQPGVFYPKLIDFLQLNISPSLRSNFVNSNNVLHFNESGCFDGPYTCKTYSKRRSQPILVPSVCSERLGLQLINNRKGLPSSLRHMEQCADKYAGQVAAVLSNTSFPVKDVILRVLLDQYVALTKYSTKTQIVLNIGPGSSGTRSLFLATQQLNITGRHWDQVGVNCQMQNRGDALYQYNDHFDALDGYKEPFIFWGDVPVPELWWQFLQLYPETKMIMTDMNATKWRQTRIPNSCETKSNDMLWNGCTAPVPFTFNNKLDAQLKVLHQLMHINKISLDTNEKLFELYRQLVRCAVPSKQLLWIEMAKQSNPATFWNGLIDFLQVPVKPQLRSNLISSGVPYIGKKGCRVGAYNCSIRTLRLQYSSPFAPSVCYPELTMKSMNLKIDKQAIPVNGRPVYANASAIPIASSHDLPKLASTSPILLPPPPPVATIDNSAGSGSVGGLNTSIQIQFDVSVMFLLALLVFVMGFASGRCWKR